MKDKNHAKLKAFMKMNNNWERIKKWFDWWFNWQGIFDNKGKHLDLFKWWGPDPCVNLGSGMDDFPRNTEGYEAWANIDATAWGYFFTDSVYELAKFCGEEKDFLDFLRSKKNHILFNLKTHLFDKEDHLYKDKLINLSDKSFMFSFHLGYPNLMPLIFGMIDDNSTELDAALNFLSNPSTIWTDYGLASLSKEDFYYGQGSNYWRGPVWININFLVLRSLRRYYSKNIKARSIYEKLRENVMNTVCTNWEKSGCFFEHYNQDQNGKGNGHKFFNGWTSLITLIIGEDY
jgi:mannosyl-oligosaccharide glucosidase